MTDHARKINRAQKHSKIGDNGGSFTAMLGYVPPAALDKLSARDIAALVDAFWDCALASKALANQEALAEGAVWDAKAGILRALA